MIDEEKKSKRQIVGYALMGSAFVMLGFAVLIYNGSFDISEQARTIVATVIGVVSATDLALAAYFIMSDPS
jgi:FtsH-binding integral membrane protein